MNHYCARLIMIAVATLQMAGCATMGKIDKGLYQATNAVAPPDRVTGDRTVNFASRKQQIQKSDQNARAMLAEMEKRGLKRDAALDPVAYERVSRVFSQIHSVSHLRNEKWTVVLLPDPSFNAFVLGGTYMFVNQGLLTNIKNDDELAAVIGHEIGHVAANHAYEQSSNMQLSQLAGRKARQTQQFQAAYTLENEREADRIGILYAALAGYDPLAASRVWERLFAEQGNQRNGFTDHPVNSDRANETQQIGEKVLQYYTAGQINPKASELLVNNALWQKKHSEPEGGKGGGFAALLTTASNSYIANQKAKQEQLRQQTLQNDINFVVSHLTLVSIQPAGLHTLHLVIEYRGGGTVRAKGIVYAITALVPGSDAPIRVVTTVPNWLAQDTRFAVDFTAADLPATAVQLNQVRLSVDDILTY